MLTEGNPPNQLLRPRLIFFYGATCGASRRVEAILGHVLQHNRNHDTFVAHKADVQDPPPPPERFALRAPPAVCVIAEKGIAARGVRPRTVADLRELLGPWLKQAPAG